MRNVVRSALIAVVLLVTGRAYAHEGGTADTADEPTAQALRDGLVTYEKGQFSTSLHLRIQGWGGWVADDADLTNGDRMQETGFMLRRARFGFDGQFMKGVTYDLEMDLFDQERAGGPLYAAWIAWRPSHWFGTVLGVQPFPFLMGEMVSSGELPHLDRAIGANAMSPENTMGLLLKTEPWEEHLTISAGLFNGLRRASSFFGGYEGVGVSMGNRFEELAYAARLDFQPLAPIGRGIADIGQGEEFRLALGGAGLYNDGSSILTMGYSAYLHAKLRGVHLFAEYAADKAEPRDKPTTTSTIAASLERRVFNVSLGYVFLKDVLGLAFRGELLDDNLDQETQGDEWQLTGTLTWYVVGDFFKAQIEYTHREELHGLPIENDAAMGGVQLLF